VKCKSSDAGYSDMPKKSLQTLPSREKVEVLDLKRRKSFMLSLYALRMNLFLICEVVKKEKESNASFAALPHTANIVAKVHDNCIVRMERKLNLRVEDMNRKYVVINRNVLRQKALSLHNDLLLLISCGTSFIN
jgi:hypothetical protein